MELKLVRKYCKDEYTIGQLFVIENGKAIWVADTLEDKVRDYNKDGDLLDEGEEKVYSQTAIPYGKYEVKMTISPKFKNRYWAAIYGGIVPLIDNVKHFTGIRFHPAKTAADLSGCVGVGRNTLKGQLTQSTDMYFNLMDNYLIPAMNRNESITLEIV
ncbi:MAG: hypothetical protein II304_00305 [Bacteroidales bacterium]|nr:hypothetical protein [Bacteroidales bacterium]